MALTMANWTCNCPCLGSLAVSCCVRAHCLVVIPISTSTLTMPCTQGTNALGLVAVAFSVSPAGSTPTVPLARASAAPMKSGGLLRLCASMPKGLTFPCVHVCDCPCKPNQCINPLLNSRSPTNTFGILRKAASFNSYARSNPFTVKMFNA